MVEYSLHVAACLELMDEGQWQSEGPVRRGAVGDSELLSEVGSAHSPDQNQNRLLEEGEEVDQGPRGGQNLFQQDSVNNNGREEEDDERSRAEEEEETETEDLESNSEACSPDGALRDSPSLSPSPTVCEGPLTPEEVPHGGVVSPRELVPSLATSLQVLEEQGDHALLPHCLHQIAEALVLQGDYARAVTFIQLQRLYHQRVLSNLAALQEQWESRWRVGDQSPDSSSVDRAAATPSSHDTEHLEKLRHICQTHRQPAQSVERRELVVKAQTNNVMSVEGDHGTGTYGTDQIMEEQNIHAGFSPKQDGAQPEDSGGAPLSLQGAPKLFHKPSPHAPPSPSATPSSAVTDGGEEQSERAAVGTMPGQPSALTLEETPLPGSLREAGGDPDDTGQEKGVDTVTSTSLEEVEQVEAFDLEARRKELGLEAHEENPEEEVDEEGQEVEVLEEEEKVATLDDLAKRIQVEEITPAAGLVSILKRGGSLDGAPPPVPKPGSKRKVRFRVPDDCLDHDDVGGDSWLLLLLLCLATVVISVGGTALYCTFGDAKSSVCTDFSHNVDFYIGQVQRGAEELRHWFSPGS